MTSAALPYTTLCNATDIILIGESLNEAIAAIMAIMAIMADTCHTLRCENTQKISGRTNQNHRKLTHRTRIRSKFVY